MNISAPQSCLALMLFLATNVLGFDLDSSTSGRWHRAYGSEAHLIYEGLYSGSVLDWRQVVDFQDGVYVKWRIAQTVILLVTRLSRCQCGGVGPEKRGVVVDLRFPGERGEENISPIPRVLPRSDPPMKV